MTDAHKDRWKFDSSSLMIMACLWSLMGAVGLCTDFRALGHRLSQTHSFIDVVLAPLLAVGSWVQYVRLKRSEKAAG